MRTSYALLVCLGWFANSYEYDDFGLEGFEEEESQAELLGVERGSTSQVKCQDLRDTILAANLNGSLVKAKVPGGELSLPCGQLHDLSNCRYCDSYDGWGECCQCCNDVEKDDNLLFIYKGENAMYERSETLQKGKTVNEGNVHLELNCCKHGCCGVFVPEIPGVEYLAEFEELLSKDSVNEVDAGKGVDKITYGNKDTSKNLLWGTTYKNSRWGKDTDYTNNPVPDVCLTDSIYKCRDTIAQVNDQHPDDPDYMYQLRNCEFCFPRDNFTGVHIDDHYKNEQDECCKCCTVKEMRKFDDCCCLRCCVGLNLGTRYDEEQCLQKDEEEVPVGKHPHGLSGDPILHCKNGTTLMFPGEPGLEYLLYGSKSVQVWTKVFQLAQDKTQATWLDWIQVRVNAKNYKKKGSKAVVVDIRRRLSTHLVCRRSISPSFWTPSMMGSPEMAEDTGDWTMTKCLAQVNVTINGLPVSMPGNGIIGLCDMDYCDENVMVHIWRVGGTEDDLSGKAHAKYMFTLREIVQVKTEEHDMLIWGQHAHKFEDPTDRIEHMHLDMKVNKYPEDEMATGILGECDRGVLEANYEEKWSRPAV